MVNTIVTFGNNNLSSIPSNPLVIKNNVKTSLQQRLYLIIGILMLIIILIPNILSIQTDYDDFVYHILFMFHAISLLLFFISITIYRNISDGITTILSLILFAIYKTIHYVIRHRHCRINSRKDFLISTIQLTILLIFVITYILWTYLLIRKKNTKKIKNFEIKQKRIFYSLLSFNLMLIISSLILNIRTQETFGLYQILILSIGIPFALLWCTIGILMSMHKNCLCISLFYLLSLIQPFHIIYLIFQILNELNNIVKENERNEFLSLFIIIFVCICTNIFVHLFTIITGCWMISKTDKIIFNTRWMLTSI